MQSCPMGSPLQCLTTLHEEIIPNEAVSRARI